MGRKSLHTADELRELIIGASTGLIQDSGLAGLSAREIARRIDYSPGTLYNAFENLDDLVLTIEGRLLDGLAEALAELSPEGTPEERVHRAADCYLGFAVRHPRLWNLLFEHHIPDSRGVPDWYRQKLDTLGGSMEDVLRPLCGSLGPNQAQRAARVLWASVHGLSSLAAADKLSVVPADDASELMNDLVRSYLAGLKARAN